MTNTSSRALIGYKRDYDPKEDGDINRQSYQVQDGGTRKYLKVRVSDGSSVEHFLVETAMKLEEVEAAIQGGWTGPQKFSNLKECLEGKIKDGFTKIVDRDYPNQANKTNANYTNLVTALITHCSDDTYPGDKQHEYITTKIRYLSCRDENGVVDKPGDVLSRFERLKKYGRMMHHNQGVNYITNAEMKKAFWLSFPQVMRDWLTNDQDTDPFDTTNPLDAQEIADQMQRYYNMHLKNEKKDNSKRKGEQHEPNNGEGYKSNKRNKKNGSGYQKSNGGGYQKKNGGGGNNNHVKCSITGHENHRHNWTGCFLNPYSKKFNAEDAEKFFNNQANGANAWYRDVYQGWQNKQRNGGGYNQGNGGYQGRGGGQGYQGGRGYQGRGGRGGGRGYQGRGGGRGGGYNNNNGNNGNNGYNNNNQGQGQGNNNNGNGNNYHNQGGNNNYQGGNGNYQGGGGNNNQGGGYHFQANGNQQQQQQQNQGSNSYHFGGAVPPQAPSSNGRF